MNKLTRALLPLVLAFVLVGILLFSPLLPVPQYTMNELKTFAHSPQLNSVFVGNEVKSKAFSSNKFLPILGSSELEKFDSFHPSSYFTKYNHGFTPFLAGQPGTQSLTQFFYVNSVASELKNKKAVFIISPQWFVKQGLEPGAFTNFVSKGEIYSWIEKANPEDSTTQEMAKRLLKMPDLTSDLTMKAALNSLSHGRPVNPLVYAIASSSVQIWKRQDSLFSGFTTYDSEKGDKNLNLSNFTKSLPNDENPNDLQEIAYAQGEKAANNNQFNVNNQVWTKNLSKGYEKRQGQMSNVSYLQSPEYADFQQLLNEFAKNNMDVQFVIQPVNGAWYSYAGLSEQTLQAFATKITYQLRTQGFTNIVDLTDKYNELYYIGDTIHFGTRGWLTVDQNIEQFMKDKQKSDYYMNNDLFLSQKWQNDTDLSPMN